MNEYNHMPYDQLMNKAYSYLDKIDFKPYIEKYEDLNDLIQEVEDMYDSTELTNNDFLNGYIFYWLYEEELAAYIKKRYNVDYREEVITRYVRGKL